MPNFVEVIGALGQIREAVSALKNDKGRREFGYPNEHFTRIGQALSDIHFSEDGILHVLKRIEATDTIDDEDRRRLVEFNQIEEPMRSSMEDLILDHGRKSRHSLKQSSIINDIRGRKRTLRHAVQSAINHALTFDSEIDMAEVAELVAEIEALNQDIEEAEHALRVFL